jgi:hypothetical protein
MSEPEKFERVKRLLIDFFSIDVITAKGDIAAKFTPEDTLLAQISADKKIRILARTVIQFGGDQLTIIPTADGKAGGSTTGSLNREILDLHMENVAKALERRKDNLDTILKVIDIISKFVEGIDNEMIVDAILSTRQSKAVLPATG